jgi:nitrite reductase (NO-forming)
VTPRDGAAPAATGDRVGLLGGLALGVVMLLVALSVALTGGARTVPGDDAAVVVPAGGTRTAAVRLVDMRITPSVLQVAAGTRLVLEVSNTGAMRHDLLIDGGPHTPLLAPGSSARLDLGTLSRTLQGWCSVPGHKAAGMTLTIKVTGGDLSGGGHAMATTPPATAVAGAAPVIDFHTAPGPGWSAYDPTLRPADGATEHRLTLRVTDSEVEVAPGVRQRLWTYNGTAPGPTLHGKVGDVFTVTFTNDASTGHGIDFHASSLAPDAPMRTLAPGRSLTYQFTAHYAGAWLYHCSTMPMSLHLANGMYGAVIIDPPDLAQVDRELVLLHSELYLGIQGGIADEAKIAAERPDAVVFNGYVNQYDHAPIRVRVGERVRVWVVDAGPQRSMSFHVVGAQFDTVFKEGAYALQAGNAEHGAAQALDLGPGQGGFVEFALPAAGHYPLTDHAMVDAERGAHGMLEAR